MRGAALVRGTLLGLMLSVVVGAAGATRAGRKVAYATTTVAASSILPGWEMYTGTPLDFGHMGPSASDPAVSLQYGMVAGIADAGQLNALSTLNLRGERSVSSPGIVAPTRPRPERASATCLPSRWPARQTTRNWRLP